MKFITGIFILMLFGCQSNQNQLPILSYKMDDEGNQVSYKIHYENFENQSGKSFSTDNIEDKVIIANFFFTRCPSICPPMRTQLIDIAESFKYEDDVLIVSHTIDPENDSVEILKNYSEATGIPPTKWQFLRASLEKTKQLANQFMTNFRPDEDGTDFYHSSYVALVDKNQHIRGFYNSLDETEVDRLKTDIKRLLE